MQEIRMPVARDAQSKVRPAKRRNGLSVPAWLFYPVGVVRIWRTKRASWKKWVYTVIGLPVFIIVFAYAAIITFAAFLPALDRTCGQRADRTICNRAGDYSARFVATGNETNGT